MNPRIRSIILAAAFASVTASVVGCAGDNRKTQKQAATEQWNDTRAAVLCSLANDQYRSGNFDKCQQTINQAMAMNPKNERLYLLGARVDIEQGALESAEHRLQIAGELAPNDAEVDYMAGVVQQRWERPEDARIRYHAAAQKKPDDVAYVLAEAEMLVVLDRRDEALALLTDHVVYFEHSAAIRDAIAQLYEQGGRLDDAVEYYRQASVLDSDDLGIHERLGSLLYRRGQYAEALTQLRHVERAPESAKRNDLKLMIAECVLQSGTPDAARQLFDEVTNADPTSVTAWIGVAKCSLRLDDLRRAELAAVKAAALQPRSSEAQMILGYVRMKQGRNDDAMTCFARGSAADSQDGVSLSMMGMLMQKQGRTVDAVALYRRALTIDPHDELALKLMASTAEPIEVR